jgi:hypothetical protein
MDLARQLPSMDLQVGEEDGFSISGPVGTVLFIGFLTLLPTVLLMMTGFTRILVVLHLLKQAMGTQTAPPAHLLAAMALLLTGFVMTPVLNGDQPDRPGALDGRRDGRGADDEGRLDSTPRASCSRPPGKTNSPPSWTCMEERLPKLSTTSRLPF